MVGTSLLASKFRLPATANGKAVKSSESFQPARQPSVKALSIEAPNMKAEYDLSKLQARKNPYASKLKKPVTMRVIALPITARCKSTGR